MQRDPVLAVVTICVVSQERQVIPHLTGYLPEPLPLLPAVPAIKTRRAEDHNQRDGEKGFDKRKAMFVFHGGSVAEWQKRRER
ncbi:hypothetical protein AN661_0204805 [Enterobacter hormaechei subsp. hoffmannii]|nr:hypothetical protein AN661_0204805 [Enterobacter hormaechei subsp. hoffmannii]